LSPEACIAVLNLGTSGTLAVAGDNGYPYAVPLSYVYHDKKLYFHCAKTGHKLDAIQRNPKVSFCVIDQDQVASQRFTTYFRSVIVFGKAHILTSTPEIRKALELLASKYAPQESAERRHQEIERELEALCVFELSIEQMTGKEAVELIQAKLRQPD
jgi:nitroimidazol reductase NimA-like FMN-containing flavoprotein (pyridoxamine 5'-phosphate oxidase superfamily)